MAECRFTPSAQRDLDDMFDYSVKHWGLAQAIRYTDLIETVCKRLAEVRIRHSAAMNYGLAIDAGGSSSMSSTSAGPAPA